MTRLSLPDKILAIHRSLRTIPHAFGGALALAYYAEPRATIDIDLNVFVSPDQAAGVFARLAKLGVNIDGASGSVIDDGQTRVMWEYTPIDLFFSYDPFHDAAERGTIEVPFAGASIRVLSATHLAVCKAVFNRPKDWLDIEAMIALDTYIDTAEALRWTGRIAGDEDQRYNRLAALLSSYSRDQ